MYCIQSILRQESLYLLAICEHRLLIDRDKSLVSGSSQRGVVSNYYSRYNLCNILKSLATDNIIFSETFLSDPPSSCDDRFSALTISITFRWPPIPSLFRLLSTKWQGVKLASGNFTVGKSRFKCRKRSSNLPKDRKD